MVKRRKKKSNILSGLIIVLCILMILPVLSFAFKVNEPDAPVVDDTPTEELQLYYKVSFVVGECCYSINPLYVKVGEKPVLPDCDVKCSHVSYDEETDELTEQHVFVGWTYNGQYISQLHCPAFNTNVVLVAQFETRSGPVELIYFPPEWSEL